MNLQDEMFKKYLAELAAQRQNYVELEPQQPEMAQSEPQTQLQRMDEPQQPVVDPLQASLEQKQAGTLEAQKRYADWLQGLAKRSAQSGKMQSEALSSMGEEALGSRAVNQMGAVAMSLLNQPGLAKMYGEQAQDAGKRFGESQKAGATQFNDYLAKVAGIEERALGGQLDAATKAEGIAANALQQRNAAELARIRHLETLAATATTTEQRLSAQAELENARLEQARMLAFAHMANSREIAEMNREGKAGALEDKYSYKFEEDLSKVDVGIPGWKPRVRVDELGRKHIQTATPKDAEGIKDASVALADIEGTGKQLMDIMRNKRFSSLSAGEEGQIRDTLQTILSLDSKSKAMFDLGVLNGPDLGLIQKAIGKDGINWDIITKEGGAARIQTLINNSRMKLRNNLERRGYYFEEPNAKASIPPGKVKVISPDGKTGLIPAEQLEAAKKQGYRVAR